MREIRSEELTRVIKRLCKEACYYLPEDVRACIEKNRKEEPWAPAAEILDKIITNYHIAEENSVPICQDTGVACVFLDIGQDVHITGDIEAAVNRGVSEGYTEGYLRKSVVSDPIERKNSGDNTPAMIYYNIVPGDKLTVTVAPKGFGSENMSQIKMLKPADGLEGVKAFILKVCEEAGPNPCPPVIVGVGIGGTFDKAAYMAKRALLRPLDEPNPDRFYADLEEELREKINEMGVGPQGFGGKTYALKVNIEHYATHIAGLPVAVNIQCHVARHKTEVI